MTSQAIHIHDEDGFIDQLRKMEESNPDNRIVLGDASLSPELVSEHQYKRLGDFVYPAELFLDPYTPQDVYEADTQFIATGVFPAEEVTEEASMSYDELVERVKEAASEFRDPFFVIGVWSPSGSYQIYGNSDNDKPRRISSIEYPEAAFSAGGNGPLRRLHLGFMGTVIIEREKLTEDTIAFGLGETDELPVHEREDTRMSPEEIHEVLSGLAPGDEISINDRSRNFRVVTAKEYAEHRPPWTGDQVYLVANGTAYHVSLRDETNRPRLKWKSDSEYLNDVEVVSDSETAHQEVLADD